MNIHYPDAQLLFFINQGMANDLFDVLMPALSRHGYLLVLPFLLALVPWSVRARDASGGPSLSSVLGAVLISCFAVYLGLHAEDVLKAAVARVRPCRALDGIRLVIPCPESYSMPSGHAISSFAFAAPLVHLTWTYAPRAWRLYPLALAASIACSRIYLGVHYPTDVIAGAAVGAAIGLSLSLPAARVLRMLQRKRI